LSVAPRTEYVTRVAVAVALLVLLSGCNAFGGSGGDGPVDGSTVSPAPVPVLETTEATPTPTPGRCLAPRPAAPTNRTLGTPAETAALPGRDGVVNGSALVERHVGRLANHRFHLNVSDGTDVRSMPDAAAFAFEGIGIGVPATHGYAVGGSLYTIEPEKGEVRVVQRPYRLGSETNERYVRLLTGGEWLADRVGDLDYELVDTTTRNGTEVRVLRDTMDQRLLLGPDAPFPGIVGINATLYVDRRGIVRHARYVRDIQYEVRTGVYRNVTEVETLTVDELGTARVRRPGDFCVAASDDAALVTPRSVPDGSGERVPSGVGREDVPAGGSWTPTPNASETRTGTPRTPTATDDRAGTATGTRTGTTPGLTTGAGTATGTRTGTTPGLTTGAGTATATG
jgi:hypothetical protein